MKKASLLQLAENLGFLIFTLGAAGIGLGMVVGMIGGSDDAGQTWLVSFLASSITFAVAGGLMGSLADAATPAQKRTRHTQDQFILTPPATSQPKATSATAFDARAKSAARPISAFRAVPKPTQRPATARN